MAFTGAYGSSRSIVPVEMPSLSGHTGTLSDDSNGVITLTKTSDGYGAKRVYLQLLSSDLVATAFESDLKVFININQDTAPAAVGTAGAKIVLVPNNQIVSLDLFPYSTCAKIGYRVIRNGTPAGDVEWGKTLLINVVY